MTILVDTGLPMPTVEQFKRIKEIIRGAVPTEEERAWLQPLGWWPGDRLVGTADKVPDLLAKKIEVMIPQRRDTGHRRITVETVRKVSQQTWFPA